MTKDFKYHLSLTVRRCLTLYAIIFLTYSHLNAQQQYPADYFRPPLDIRLLLSGTFGELRANHFHSGIDIKTNGAAGEEVYAIADGYISRINVSTYGFGKALYINHPNGYTSVYAHLDYFTGPVHGYVMEEHYKRESFEMTVYPEPGELPVKKGDVIAYTGNSGSSSGPHLHFEIRDEKTQVPMNPLLFGFEVKDYYRPSIRRIKIYAADSNSRVNGRKQHAVYPVGGWGEKHRLDNDEPIILSGAIGFGVQCYDRQNDTPNKNGVYSVKVYLDDGLVSSTRMESFPFSESRYINSLVDYEEYQRSKIRFQRTEIDPGNRLNIYEVQENRGLVFIDDDLLHRVRIELTDIMGNLAVLVFDVRGEKAIPAAEVKLNGELSYDPSLFYYNGHNSFEKESFLLDAPAGAFYRSFHFTYSTDMAPDSCLSPVHHVHNRYTPIHEAVTIAIKPSGLAQDLYDKALIVRLDEDTPVMVSAGGSYGEDGYVRTKIRDFGDYSITLDTIPPLIAPLNKKAYKKGTGQVSLKFKIKDELSGIKSYRGTLNGKWVLLEYDAKNDLLFGYLEEHLKAGENLFLLEVMDMKENLRVYETTLVR